MTSTMRFGRKIALPSTRQIIHELRVMAALEAQKSQALSADETQTEVIGTPGSSHSDTDRSSTQ